MRPELDGIGGAVGEVIASAPNELTVTLTSHTGDEQPAFTVPYTIDSDGLFRIDVNTGCFFWYSTCCCDSAWN